MTNILYLRCYRLLEHTPELFWLKSWCNVAVYSQAYFRISDYAALFLEFLHQYATRFLICILLAWIVESAGIHIARNENSYDSLANRT